MEVMGCYAGVIGEELLTHPNIPFLNTYEQAKLESEEWLREQIGQGVPIQIFRISMVVGETTSGRIRRFQSFYLLTEKLILAPQYPAIPGGAPIDVFPVDLWCRAIVAVMESGPPESICIVKIIFLGI
jgi:thioester reductase-like protein